MNTQNKNRQSEGGASLNRYSALKEASAIVWLSIAEVAVVPVFAVLICVVPLFTLVIALSQENRLISGREASKTLQRIIFAVSLVFGIVEILFYICAVIVLLNSASNIPAF